MTWFSADSPWNTPRSGNLVEVPWISTLEFEFYERSVSIAKRDDPFVDVLVGSYYSTASPDDGKQMLPSSFRPRTKIRLPAGATPVDDTDRILSVIDSDGSALDCYGVTIQGSRLFCARASEVDLEGMGDGWENGMCASMLPSFAGLVRSTEWGRIDHALAALAPPTLLKREAAYPAYAWDRSPGYTGTIPMGSRLALPMDYPLNGLPPEGIVLAQAAQRYGVILVDRGGSGFSILLERSTPGAIPPLPDWHALTWVHGLRLVIQN
jgi:hypothetical protein